MRLYHIGMIAALALLTACGEREEILPGERLDLRDGLVRGSQTTAVENQVAKISLGKQVSREAWTTVGATRLHASGHNAFTAATPNLTWTGAIGSGNSRKYRITADPVAANGIVAAMDAFSTVTALRASSGEQLWSVDLTPLGETAGDAAGGALTINGSTLYATTGYGEVIALNLSNGAEIWRQNLDAVGAAGLAVYEGLVYVVAGNAQGWAIDAKTGRVRWTVEGPETVTSRVGAASPVVTDKYVIFPFASGDMYGVFRKGGIRYWNASVTGRRTGVVYANVSDISSDPVVVGNSFYAGNQSGRFAAFNLETGERTWTAREGGYSVSLVLGGSVFVISDDNSLVRLSARDGGVIWKQQLPYFKTDNERRQRDVFAHFGPVAAGGKLWVASSDSILRGIDPTSGVVTTSVELPDAAASAPIIVGGVMYIMLANGTLAALN